MSAAHLNQLLLGGTGVLAVARHTVNLVVLAAAGFLGFALYLGYILIPAWSSYSRVWERLAATVLSLYVLGVLIGVGIGAALAAVYFWG
jgi:hypothetical protein